MKLCVPAALIMALSFSAAAQAQQINPTFVGRDDNILGITGIHEVMRDCSQHVGKITVTGLQYSLSGLTIDLIRSTDAKNKPEMIPTSFGDFSNTFKTTAQEFVKQGRSYFVHTQTCGSGGFVDLIAIYQDGSK